MSASYIDRLLLWLNWVKKVMTVIEYSVRRKTTVTIFGVMLSRKIRRQGLVLMMKKNMSKIRVNMTTAPDVIVGELRVAPICLSVCGSTCLWFSVNRHWSVAPRNVRMEVNESATRRTLAIIMVGQLMHRLTMMKIRLIGLVRVVLRTPESLQVIMRI